ncbi:hypothetical protein [Streptomyces sp. B21-101]|uniref:hypothetical protein n=1 Tax=Streptomyces sp. B21-101 TaxID=3039415 RepID=UPI002FEF7FA9
MFTEFGERYRDKDGYTYIVIEPRTADCRHALLMEDAEILRNPDGFEWSACHVVEDYIERPVRIEDNPEMTRLARRRAEEERVRGEIVGMVPPNEWRRFFNAMYDANECSAMIASSQADVVRYSAIRARELQKMVDIVGSQPPVARLLGMNQSTLSRALRPRSTD